MDYRSAGVDVEAGRAFVERIRRSVEATHRPEVLGGLGGFDGLCRLPAGLRRPLLVAGTDGVGTKLELAQDLERHRGIGIDLVVMCVNDVITTGAEPLLFLDYVATGRLSPGVLAEVVEGIADGCTLSGCALQGGETAEMPGFYPRGRYDLAGFCLAVVDEDQLIDGRAIQAGHALVGVASRGVHSNGFSLVRRILELPGVAAVRLADGRDPAVLDALLDGERVGTVFQPSATPLPDRKGWLAHALLPKGSLRIDAGAERALTERGASLLAVGIQAVEGEFLRGEPVRILSADGRELGRGLSALSSGEVAAILGLCSEEVRRRLGAVDDAVVHRDALVLIPAR